MPQAEAQLMEEEKVRSLNIAEATRLARTALELAETVGKKKKKKKKKKVHLHFQPICSPGLHIACFSRTRRIGGGGG
jgi:hypothetical protein